MKFTIGTASSSLDFEEDLKLIKSSLLYADEIELIGMAEYAVFKYLPDRIDSVKDIRTLADSFIPLLKSINVSGSKEIVQQLELIKEQIVPFEPFLKKNKHRTRQEILAQMQVSKVMNQSRQTLLDAMSQFTGTPGAKSIENLIEKNIISVFDYKNSDFNLDALAGGYFGNLIRTMQNGMAYPLFDKTSNDVVAAFAKKQLLDLGNVNQEVLVHAGVATNILMTLPTLEAASVDEILDFKKEMQGALVNFRSAVYEFSEKIESRPWDKDFQYDCLKIYGKEVAPRVEELNILATDSSVLKNFGSKVLRDEEVRKNVAWMTGGLVSTITTSSNMIGALDVFKNWLLGLSMIVIAPNAASAFLKTLSMASETNKEIKEVNKDMRQNTMYYYYKAAKDLH